MKTLTKLISVIAVISLVVTAFTGCADEPETVHSDIPTVTCPTALAVAVQNTKCNALYNFSKSSVIYKTIQDVASFEGSVLQSYEYDGQAYPLRDEIEVKFEAGLSDANKKSLAETNASKILRSLNEATPQTAEVDFIYLLRQISAFVQSRGLEGKRGIIIGNLLSTAGIINHAAKSIYVGEDDFFKYANSEMPDMTGVHITYFITETADEQTMLQQSDIDRLCSLYERLITSAGGTINFVGISGQKSTVDKSNWCNVSTVDIRTKEYNGKLDITLDETSLEFIGDSTEFVDENQAKETLSKYVEPINQSQNGIVLAASTASTEASRQDDLVLSQQRAERTREILIDLGCDSNKITAIGIGKESHKWRVDDSAEFASEETKKANRVVYLTDTHSEKADEFLSIANQI